MAASSASSNPYGLNAQDFADLKAIRAGMKASDPRIAKVDALLSSYIEPSAAEKSASQMAMNRAVNASPTQFELARNPSFQEGIGASFLHGLRDIGSGVANMIPHAARTIANPIEGAYELSQSDIQRKNAGRSLPYRSAAMVATAAGVNPQGMEQAADLGNRRAIIGQAGAQIVPPLVATEIARHR